MIYSPAWYRVPVRAERRKAAVTAWDTMQRSLHVPKVHPEHFIPYQKLLKEQILGNFSLVYNNALDLQHQGSLFFFPEVNNQKSILFFAPLHRRFLHKICSALTQSIYCVVDYMEETSRGLFSLNTFKGNRWNLNASNWSSKLGYKYPNTSQRYEQYDLSRLMYSCLCKQLYLWLTQLLKSSLIRDLNY